MWSLHISELTWRDLFSLFIPWVYKREKKLPFDDFLLFRLLLWWVEIKKKKSLKFEGKVCRLFSDKQMLPKWGRHREKCRGHRHEAAERAHLPPKLASDCQSYPGFPCPLMPLDMPSSTDLLPPGKEGWEWGILKQPFYTTCNKVCIDKRGLTELMEPLWFWKACLFYYSTLCTGFWSKVLDAETASLNQPLYQLQRNCQSSGQLDMVTSGTCIMGERC